MKSWPFNTNRKSMFAGQFYPAGKAELETSISKLFEQSKLENNYSDINTEHHLQALISPHAGYIFSGEVAASAFNQIPENNNYKRVFVLASSHRYSFNGASVYCDGNYETPLGEIKVDIKLAKQLVKSSEVFSNKTEPHENEHSLEVQLPFLQYKLGNDFQLIPIILGTNNSGDCEKIASVLKPFFTRENLFVISTDFSHYPGYNAASKADKKTADAICSNQPKQLQATLNENKKGGIENLSTSLCGWTSVLSLLNITKNSDCHFEKITYQNSGDSKIYGDKTRVVGYWAIAVYKAAVLFKVTETERDEIIEKARHSIKTYLETGKTGKLLNPKFTTGILNDCTGVFVSVYIKDELRGCIGAFAQEKTLNELVQEMAVSAARDRRFKSVELDELKNIKLEISVLSPLKKVESINEIELGKHGIFIRQGLNTGTFLPQVADKTDWNIDQFLGHCSRDKAGIGWTGWKNAELFTYEVIILKDGE